MTRDDVLNDYFAWLYDIVCGSRYPKHISYKKLLMLLHNTEFRYPLLRDEARAEDGVGLRYRFAIMQPHEDLVESILDYLDGPCSVLEMMIALALRCEENIMDDSRYGDRTGQWFWGMLANMDLGSMIDERFDRRVAEIAINRLLDRAYDQDGRGGLFTVKDCDRDMRTADIWYQLCRYLDKFR